MKKTLDATACAALAMLVAASTTWAGLASAPPVLRPDGRGDQVIFYYDARDGFTTFLAVRNADPAASPLTVRLTFYSGGFSVPHVEDIVLGSNELRIVDVGSLRADGLSATSGIAFANGVDEGGAPIVTRALAGNFTVANLTTASAWGGPGAARSAVFIEPATEIAETDAAPFGSPKGFVAVVPPLGTVIDGTSVALSPIQPIGLDLAAYYDPEDLAPVDEDGNQIVFVSFADLPGVPYAAAPESTLWDVVAHRSDGTLIADTSFGAAGVVVTDLVSLLGNDVNGAAGSIHFRAPETSAPVTRLIFFAEALGTFGTGYLLPTGGMGPGPVR